MNNLLNLIVGQPEAGQRKMAFGFHVSLILAAVIAAATVGTWIAPDAKAALLKEIAGISITALQWVFGLLMGGNIGEHVAGAFGGKKAS